MSHIAVCSQLANVHGWRADYGTRAELTIDGVTHSIGRDLTVRRFAGYGIGDAGELVGRIDANADAAFEAARINTLVRA